MSYKTLTIHICPAIKAQSFLDKVAANLYPALLTTCPHRLCASLTRGPHSPDRLLEKRLQLPRSNFHLLLEITHCRSIKSRSLGKRKISGLGFRVDLFDPFASRCQGIGNGKIWKLKRIVASCVSK
jgi:hypothetical protein